MWLLLVLLMAFSEIHRAWTKTTIRAGGVSKAVSITAREHAVQPLNLTLKMRE